MQLDLLKNLEQYTKRNRRRSIWRKIVRFLACIVVFCTTYALILPALTMEQPTFCNHEEHVHTEDCYIQLDASANLICTPEVHTHNELCFDESGNIICGVADYLGHTHTEECYGEDGTLICTIPETVWHVHDESCLVPAQPKLICGITEGDIHFHDDSCYTINITINNNQIPTEDIAHVHSVVCYDELGNLICGLEGSVYHVHGTECYDEFGTLICLLEETAQETGNNDLFSTSEDRTLICTLIEGEGHSHTELCYEAPETEFVLGCACNIPTHTHNELCFDEFGNIICGMSENIAHIHDSVYCYDANGNLVCPLLETAVHVHTAECFAAHEQPLTCGLEENEEHTHSNLCYGTWQFICTAEEHTHDLACYSDPSADVETAQDWEEMLSSVSLTGVWADDVVEIAKSQIGYVESELNYAVSKDGVTPLGYTRYGEWFGVPYDEDWSAAFASFCLSYAKVEGMAFDSDCAMWVETLSAGWQDLYRNADEYTPVRGDLVFFDIDGDTVADRVGILAEIAPASENAPETLLVIEGDCFNQVQYMTYELGDASIIGYSMLPEQEPLANTYDYFDGIVDVKVEIPADSGIPEDAVLRVTPIDVTDSNYLNLLASAEVAVDGTLSRAQFYDISFYTADLEYIPVGETARVTMRFAEGVITPNADTLVLHYEDNESTPTVIEGVSISQEIVLNASTFNVLASVIETTETVLTFETDGFSVFGVVEVSTEVDPCKNIENDVTATKNVADSNIILYNTGKTITINDPNNENTIVVHVKGTTPGTFRTWLCNSANETRASDFQTFYASGEFEYFIEYTANFAESSNTVANYIQFKDQQNLELTHVGVYYGTLAEYKAKLSELGFSIGDVIEIKPEVTPGEVTSEGLYVNIVKENNPVTAENNGIGTGNFPGIAYFDHYAIDVNQFVEYAKIPGTKLWLEITNNSEIEPVFKPQFGYDPSNNNNNYIVEMTKLSYTSAKLDENDSSVIITPGSGLYVVSLNDLWNAYVNNGGDTNNVQNFSASIAAGNPIALKRAWITAPTEFADDPYQKYELLNSVTGKGTIALTDGVLVDNGWYPLLSSNLDDIKDIAAALQLPGAKIKITYSGDSDIDLSLQGGQWKLVNTSSQTPEISSIEGTIYKTIVLDAAPLLKDYLAVDSIDDLRQLGVNGAGNVIYKFEVIVPPVEDVLFENNNGEKLYILSSTSDISDGKHLYKIALEVDRDLTVDEQNTFSDTNRYHIVKTYADGAVTKTTVYDRTDFEPAKPWDGFGIGEPVNNREYGNYTLNDIKMLAEAALEGQDIKLIIEYSATGPNNAGDSKNGPMQTQFNAWDQLETDYEVNSTVTELGNGKYRAELNLKDIVDKLLATGKTTDDIRNIGVQLFVNNCVLHKVSFTMPDSTYNKLERDPVVNDLVTNLNGQIGIIVAVNNNANGINDYPAIASSPSNNHLIGANIDSVTIENGELKLVDNDYSNGNEANRIVWQFEAVPNEIGQYYIKASNYYSDNSVNNAYAGQYINITSSGLSVSTTPQAIEVVKVAPDTNNGLVKVTENVVALRINEGGTYRYVTLSENNSGYDFNSSNSVGVTDLSTHLVIADTDDPEVLKLRDLIDQLPTTKEFKERSNNSGGAYPSFFEYAKKKRKIAIMAKQAYDALCASSPELALDKNLIGYDRIEKLEELEWLWRDNPNVVPAVSLNATVKVFNYDLTINDHKFTQSDSKELYSKDDELYYRFYNYSDGSASVHGSLSPNGPGADRPVLAPLLGADGYPLFTEIPVRLPDGSDDNTDPDNGYAAVSDGSLDFLFGQNQVGSTMNDGGGLFQQDADGYYYYYSDTNAAYFDTATNRFVLYDAVVHPIYETNMVTESEVQKYVEEHAGVTADQARQILVERKNDRLSNFLPFNPVIDNIIYDVPDEAMGEGDTTFYIDEVTSSENQSATSNSAVVNAPVDLWFGMNIEFDFFIPEGAKVNGKPMEFDFHGDDDVFVYIDDVLVLNIGGCHAALDGNINFETGRVYYQTNEYGDFEDTTLGEIFRKAGKSEEYLKANFEYDEATGEYTTFKDFSTHNLKFFYMERGGSISYCGIRFNLPSIPEYDLMIGKELVDNTGKKIESDYDYTFRVVKKDDPTQLFLPANTPFDIYDNGTVVGRGYIDANGLFTLKAGQVAVFPTISGATLGGSEYIVQELMPEDVDEMYGRIEYRTDGTPSGIIKNTETTVMQVLSFYNKLLYADGCTHQGSYVQDNNTNSHYLYCYTCSLKLTENEPHTCSSWSDQNNGNHQGTCSLCNAYISVAHTWDYNNGIPNGDGTTTYTCAAGCGATKIQTSSGGSCNGNHSLSNWSSDANNHWQVCSTCQQSVNTSGHNYNGNTCTVCGYTKSNDSCQHINVKHDSLGDSGHMIRCNDCNSELGTEAHSITWSENNSEHVGRCTANNCNYEVRCTEQNRNSGCTICNNSGGNTCDHTNVTFKYISNNNDTHNKVCSCGSVVTYNESHTYGEWEILIDKHQRYCTLCGNLDPDSDSHFGGFAYNDNQHWLVCDTCGSEDTHNPHSWNEGEITTAPTETQEGVRTYTCTIGCGATKTESIPATGVQGPETVTINGTTYLVYPTDDLNLSNNNNNNKATSVVVTNTMTTELGTLKITKTGAGEQDEVFNMQVLVGSGTIARATLVPLTAGTEYKVNGETRYVGTNGIIQLKLNETAVIEGFAPGTFVEVIEILGSGQDYTPSYSGKVVDENGNVIPNPTSQIGANGTAVIGEGDTVHLTVNNAKNNARVEIPLEKTVPVHQSSATQFRFAIKQVDENGNPINNAAHIDDVSLTASWSTPSLESVVIGYENPVTGTYYYKVTEYNDGQNFFYDDTEYIVTVRIDESHNAKITNIKRDGNEYYNGEGEVPALSFLNYQMSELTVSKTVVGSDTSGEFKFRVEIRGIDDRYNFDTICGDLGFTKGTDDSGSTVYYKEDITLSHGESTELLVPMWSTVRVIETDSLGCSVSNTVINGGQSITAADDKCKPFTVDVSGAAVAFTNVRGIELPHTGGPGIYLYASGGMLLLAIFAVLLYNRINCRKEGRASS